MQRISFLVCLCRNGGKLFARFPNFGKKKKSFSLKKRLFSANDLWSTRNLSSVCQSAISLWIPSNLSLEVNPFDNDSRQFTILSIVN